VPGGSTNVLARALGFPASSVEATGVLLEALREGRGRRIGLGRATFGSRSRYFGFCAGYGVDAAVVEQVEHKRGKGRRNTPGLYLRSAIAEFSRAATRSAPTIAVSTGGTDPDEPVEAAARNAIVCNTTPWTYLNARGLRACPDASFDTGLDLLALRKLRAVTALRTITQMLSEDGEPHGRNVIARHDEASITLRADRELAFQVDGEYLGRFAEVELVSVPSALRVMA
jgi:diacylglycerol kinase family enzyme